MRGCPALHQARLRAFEAWRASDLVSARARSVRCDSWRDRPARRVRLASIRRAHGVPGRAARVFDSRSVCCIRYPGSASPAAKIFCHGDPVSDSLNNRGTLETKTTTEADRDDEAPES